MQAGAAARPGWGLVPCGLTGLGFEVDRRERRTFPGHLRAHASDAHGNRVELLTPDP